MTMQTTSSRLAIPVSATFILLLLLSLSIPVTVRAADKVILGVNPNYLTTPSGTVTPGFNILGFTFALPRFGEIFPPSQAQAPAQAPTHAGKPVLSGAEPCGVLDFSCQSRNQSKGFDPFGIVVDNPGKLSAAGLAPAAGTFRYQEWGEGPLERYGLPPVQGPKGAPTGVTSQPTPIAAPAPAKVTTPQPRPVPVQSSPDRLDEATIAGISSACADEFAGDADVRNCIYNRAEVFQGGGRLTTQNESNVDDFIDAQSGPALAPAGAEDTAFYSTSEMNAIRQGEMDSCNNAIYPDACKAQVMDKYGMSYAPTNPDANPDNWDLWGTKPSVLAPAPVRATEYVAGGIYDNGYLVDTRKGATADYAPTFKTGWGWFDRVVLQVPEGTPSAPVPVQPPQRNQYGRDYGYIVPDVSAPIRQASGPVQQPVDAEEAQKASTATEEPPSIWKRITTPFSSTPAPSTPAEPYRPYVKSDTEYQTRGDGSSILGSAVDDGSSEEFGPVFNPWQVEEGNPAGVIVTHLDPAPFSVQANPIGSQGQGGDTPWNFDANCSVDAERQGLCGPSGLITPDTVPGPDPSADDYLWWQSPYIQRVTDPEGNDVDWTEYYGGDGAYLGPTRQFSAAEQSNPLQGQSLVASAFGAFLAN